MTNFNQTDLTEAGLKLLGKRGNQIVFTRVETGCGEYAEHEDIRKMVRLKRKVQDISISSTSIQNDTAINLKFVISNAQLEESYLFTEIGVYAVDPDVGEILYAVCYAPEDKAERILQYNGIFSAAMIISLVIEVANSRDVTFRMVGLFALNEDLMDFVRQKGAAGGLAELDANGLVPSYQLPSYVDDVIEGYYHNGRFYRDSAHTDIIAGESGKIYVDVTERKTYRWTGSTYVLISEAAVRADRLSTARTINGIRFDGTESITNVGNCKTDPGTVEKTVSIDNFTLKDGAAVIVWFEEGNTAERPRLNVNGTGAKEIAYKFNYIWADSAGIIEKNGVYLFVYKSSWWHLVGDVGIRREAQKAAQESLSGIFTRYAVAGNEAIQIDNLSYGDILFVSSIIDADNATFSYCLNGGSYQPELKLMSGNLYFVTLTCRSDTKSVEVQNTGGYDSYVTVLKHP